MTGTKKRASAEARAYVQNQVDLGRSDAPAILRELDLKGLGVSRSTLYEWLRIERERESTDSSKPWSLATDETGRPDVVLTVLKGIFEASDYRRKSLTQAEARWCVKITHAAPSMLNEREGPWLVFHMARDYLRAEFAGDDERLQRLDLALAQQIT